VRPVGLEVPLGQAEIEEVHLGALVDSDGAVRADCVEVVHVEVGIEDHVIWFHIRMQKPSLVHLPQTTELKMLKA